MNINFDSINDNNDFSYNNVKTFKKFYNSNDYYDIHTWYIKHIDRLLYYNNRHCKIKILQKGNGKKEVINKKGGSKNEKDSNGSFCNPDDCRMGGAGNG